jgi:hypothetical protein
VCPRSGGCLKHCPRHVRFSRHPSHEARILRQKQLGNRARCAGANSVFMHPWSIQYSTRQSKYPCSFEYWVSTPRSRRFTYGNNLAANTARQVRLGTSAASPVLYSAAFHCCILGQKRTRHLRCALSSQCQLAIYPLVLHPSFHIVNKTLSEALLPQSSGHGDAGDPIQGGQHWPSY